jgi:ABC-type antimicrobial peptide transport system ATPase subunit
MGELNETNRTQTMNAKAEPNQKEQDLLRAIALYNPIYSTDPKTLALNVQSILCFLRGHISKEDVGIAEEHYYGADLILKCAIQALGAQIEFGDLTEQKEGGAA